MATVICVDGLAGHPQTTFGSLKKRLEEDGHHVFLADTSSVVTHEGRVEIALNAYEGYSDYSPGKIFLVGQSAGGSAVRVAAEEIDAMEARSPLLGGIVMLSPAVPRGILFMTKPLWQVIKKRWKELLFGLVVNPTEEEFESLVHPLPANARSSIIASRQPVSGVEARTLALWPPALQPYQYPTLHVYGDADTWIAPSAQGVFGKKLRKVLGIEHLLETKVVPGAGHLTLASDQGSEVIEHIALWIRRQDRRNELTKEDVANLIGFADYDRFADTEVPK